MMQRWLIHRQEKDKGEGAKNTGKEGCRKLERWMPKTEKMVVRNSWRPSVIGIIRRSVLGDELKSQ
jgi:hypothetical protein